MCNKQEVTLIQEDEAMGADPVTPQSRLVA